MIRYLVQTFIMVCSIAHQNQNRLFFFLKKTRIVHGLIIRTSFLLKKWTTRLWLIRVKLLDNPYPSDFFNTISYSESACNWIRIIHIHVGNKNYSSYPLISYSDRIRAGNYPHHFILITTSNRNPLSVQARFMLLHPFVSQLNTVASASFGREMFPM